MSSLPQGLATELADRYRLEREIGVGGMATVYLAHDLRHGRPVAVKVFRPEVRESLGADRFLREIQIAAQLHHPHILALHDSGEAAGYLYYLMPFVDGETLRARLRRDGPLPIDVALHITREVADALGYAHRRGVIHRDIKPENILLADGHAFVADFGIARAVDSATQSLTQTGFALGTPAYMAPEQAVGERELDGRADLYALGCVLHEMLTGAPPYMGATQQAVLVKRFTEPVPRVRAKRAEAPEWLDQLVVRTLATEPEGRPTDAAELLSFLAEARTPLAAVPVQHPSPSIAVLPFTNMSADPDNEYFSDGISEELITALSRLANLRVIARTSAFAFKGKSIDVREIGKALGVRHVLEGSVRSAGTQLRVSAQLIDTHDGSHVWSQRFDRRLEDVFAIQDEITTAIREAVGVRLLRQVAKTRETDAETYALYLKGMYAVGRLALRGTEAVEFLQQAVARDPSYAPAHTLLAFACTGLVAYALQDRRSALSIGVTAAEKAVELDPDSPDAHAALYRIKGLASNTWAEDGYHLQRARDLGSSRIHEQMMWIHARRGEVDEAVHHASMSIACDPINPAFLDQAALLFTVTRRYDDAKKAAREALSLDPSYWIAARWLGWAHLYTGDAAEAERVLRTAVDQAGRNVWTLSALAATLAVAGKREEARAIADELGERRRRGEPILAFSMVIATMLLDRDEAYGWAEVAVHDQDFWIPMFGSDPEFDPMHDDPRFVALSARIGNPVLPDSARSHRWWATTRPASSTVSRAPSIAVLPFANMSGDAENEYFSDGISEDLITALTRFRELKVVARTSSFAFKGRNVDVREVGRALGVRHLLEGSVRRVGTQLRISAQLIDTADGSHVWSERYDRTLENVFAIQDEITEAIRVAVGASLRGATRVGTYQTDTETYDLYLRGKALLSRGAAEFFRGRALLEQATSRDPAFLPALISLADAHCLTTWFFLTPAREGWTKISALAVAIAERDPRSGAASRLKAAAIIGMDRDFAQAERLLQQAVAANPSDVLAHCALGLTFLVLGKHAEAEAHTREVAVLDPLSPVGQVIVSSFWAMVGRFEEADAAATASIALDPQYPDGYHMRGYARVYHGRFQEALEDLSKVPGLGNTASWPVAKRCAALIGLGRTAEAREALADVLARRTSEYMAPDAIACIYGLLGDMDDAFRWLETAAEEQAAWLPFIGVEALFAPMRHDARFIPFCRKWKIPVRQLPHTALDAWPPPVPPLPEASPTPSLVVLPFTNTSPDPDTDYFADGLTEEVIADLSNVRALRVIARNSAMRLKGTDKDVRTIGQELNVSHVLAGSVRRAGNQLRITAQLASAADDQQVWAGKFNGTIEDVFDLQERLAREIVRALSVQLTPNDRERIEHRPRPDIGVLECYQRARFENYKFTAPATDRALQIARAGLAAFGQQELLLVALGHASLNRMMLGTPEPIALAEADECVKAIRDAWPNSTNADLLDGMIAYRRGDAVRCVRVMEHARTSRPADAEVLMYLAIGYFLAGRFGVARIHARVAAELDPVNPIGWNVCGVMLTYDGRREEGLALMRRGSALETDSALCRACLAFALLSMGEEEEARRWVETLQATHAGDPYQVMVASLVAAHTGQSQLARDLLTEEALGAARGDEMLSHFAGAAFALLGEPVRAIEWLEHMVRVRGFYPAYYFEELDPFTVSLRTEPRFQALLKEMKARQAAFDAAHPG